jgi:DNA-binding transcriptional LysR family regulator
VVTLLPANLQYFAEVCKAGSVSEAALALHVAPSAISRQISRLEHELGTTVFTRHARGMSLTEAGESLLAYVRRAEIEARALLASVGAEGAVQTQEIRVAATEGFAYKLVPSAMAQLRRSHPSIAFRLHVVGNLEATQMVRDGMVDVAATYSIGRQDGVRIEHLSACPLHALVAPEHPLAASESITLAELAAHPLAVGMRDSSQRELLESAARDEGLTLDVALECSRVAPICEFARSGQGAALVSDLGSHRPNDELVHVRVDHPAFGQRTAQLQTPLGQPQAPPVLEFLRLLIAQLEQA